MFAISPINPRPPKIGLANAPRFEDTKLSYNLHGDRAYISYPPDLDPSFLADLMSAASKRGFTDIVDHYYDSDDGLDVIVVAQPSATTQQGGGGADMKTHLSHSQLNDYLRCSKAYQLKRRQSAPSMPSVWLVSGVALHEAFETINRAQYAGVKVDINHVWNEAWARVYDRILSETTVPVDQWRKAGRESKEKPNREDLSWWFEEGRRQTHVYALWLNHCGWKIAEANGLPAIELDVTANYGDGVEVKGFADAVFVTADGDHVVVDFKSGTRTPSSLTQLALYAVSLSKTAGLQIDKGAFYMTRKGELTAPENLSRFNLAWFDRVFTNLDKAIDQDLFIPNVGEHCFMCEVRQSCYAGGGIDAYLFDPDHPQFSAQKLEG